MVSMFSVRSIRNRFEFFEQELQFPDTPDVEDRLKILKFVSDELFRLRESIGVVECQLRAGYAQN